MQKLFLAFLLLGAVGTLTVLSKNPQFLAIFIPRTALIKTGTTQTILATTHGFSPESITIKSATTVIWKNTTSTPANISSDPEPTHSDYPPLNLGNFPPNGSVSLTFNKPGTYKYHSFLNPLQHGQIIVQ